MEDIIRKCYSECPRTQQLHHDFAGYNLEECVQDILKKLSELPSEYKFIQVVDKELVGYYATTNIEDKDVLYTFFVRPKFRNTEYLTKFWNHIKLEIGGDFIAPIYSSNMPAKRFLERNGGQEYNFEDGSFFIFKE